MGEKLKLELKKAKQRKKDKKPPTKAEVEAAKLRIAMNKELAPHYFGEIGIPVAWLKPAKKKLANRDYNEDHMLEVHSSMALSGPAISMETSSGLHF